LLVIALLLDAPEEILEPRRRVLHIEFCQHASMRVPDGGVMSPTPDIDSDLQ
jgi:hypothetical protein